MKKLKQKFFRWLATTTFYNWALKSVVPFIRLKTYYTSMRGWKYKRGYTKLRPGDIILTLDKYKIATKIIGGDWAHAALCVAVSANEEFEVAEMTHNDYTKSTFSDLCYEADNVAIIRCRDWSPSYIKKVIKKCREFENSKYDNAFTLTRESKGKTPDAFLYCSELIYDSDVDKKLKVSLEDLEQLGRKYISPTGLWKAENVDIIWESKKETN